MSRNPFGWDYPAGAENDPNAPYNQVSEDYGLDDLKAWLRKESPSRRHDADYCISGRNDDLEIWGRQGITLTGCDDEGVECKAVLELTVSAEGSFDLPESAGPPSYEDAQQAYWNLATDIVADSGFAVEGGGDERYLLGEEEFTVHWILDAAGVPDIEATGSAVIARAEEVLEPMEKAAIGLDKLLEEAGKLAVASVLGAAA